MLLYFFFELVAVWPQQVFRKKRFSQYGLPLLLIYLRHKGFERWLGNSFKLFKNQILNDHGVDNEECSYSDIQIFGKVLRFSFFEDPSLNYTRA